MLERNNILAAQDKKTGEFDTVAARVLTDEKLKALIREVLQNGTIIKDEQGKFHFVEGGQPHG